MRCILVWMCTAMTLQAVEGPLFEVVPDPSEPTPVVEGEEPGRVAPVAPAKPVAIEFSWDGYRTLVVVGEGVGLMRPAWVATYETPYLTGTAATLALSIVALWGYSQPLAVAYRAQAFLDAEGRLHIDARKAVMSGPQAEAWYPDNFRFTLPKLVETMDDQDSGNRGSIDCLIDPLTNPTLFETLQTRVQVLVGDGI